MAFVLVVLCSWFGACYFLDLTSSGEAAIKALFLSMTGHFLSSWVDEPVLLGKLVLAIAFLTLWHRLWHWLWHRLWHGLIFSIRGFIFTVRRLIIRASINVSSIKDLIDV